MDFKAEILTIHWRYDRMTKIQRRRLYERMIGTSSATLLRKRCGQFIEEDEQSGIELSHKFEQRVFIRNTITGL